MYCNQALTAFSRVNRPSNVKRSIFVMTTRVTRSGHFESLYLVNWHFFTTYFINFIWFFRSFGHWITLYFFNRKLWALGRYSSMAQIRDIIRERNLIVVQEKIVWRHWWSICKCWQTSLLLHINANSLRHPDLTTNGKEDPGQYATTGYLLFHFFSQISWMHEIKLTTENPCIDIFLQFFFMTKT